MLMLFLYCKDSFAKFKKKKCKASLKIDKQKKMGLQRTMSVGHDHYQAKQKLP